ncbi:damage-inducible protein DinB [Polaribacter sp. SA4-10]|uniref:DinB family protein n=1 Tax=Polaribacter sp. SA4-10 TaxID=754397 RepID=UPI000B3C49CE|nr:DinB family protein [Polaribacter sp. SA4-10]ARV05962.1 damage-inducible protein DinB [Polaribacter sp. SA4-10]
MITTNEYASYYAPYIKTLLENDKSIIENLVDVQEKFMSILENLPKEKQAYAYAEGKWTIKELIQHLIDTERVFSYRAMCFARNDKTALPGFDHDLFTDNCNANKRNYKDLLDEMIVVRKSTIQLFKSFSDEDLLRIGVGSGKNMSVRAVGIIISGHQNHHLDIIKEHYL